MNTTETTTKKMAPSDIREIYSFVKSFRSEFTDTMMMDVNEWIRSLRDDFQDWGMHDGEQPNWQSYRDWMNEICSDDGMPPLFPPTETESN